MGKNTCVFAATTLGVFLLLVGGGCAWFGIKLISNMRANEILTLKNDTITHKRWIDPNKMSILKIYIFNISNPEDVIKGSKPTLRPIGPYIFYQNVAKVNLEHFPDSSLLSYKLSSSLEFEDEDSEPWMESDELTVVNVPFVNALNGDYGANLNHPAPNLSENLLAKVTVRQLLFDGIPINCSDQETSVFLSCANLGFHHSKFVRREGDEYRFSFFHYKNGILPQVYTVDTGVKDVRKAGKIMTIDRKSHLSVWKDEHCNRINGSDGTQFPKIVGKEDKLYLYDRDICRSIYIKFDEVVDDEGVELFKYVVTRDLFMAEEENPANGCFCKTSGIKLFDDDKKTETDSSGCLGTGLLSLFRCTGSSIVASFPFFYLGADKYRDYSGLVPNKHAHETYFKIEPTFGITVESCKRFQYNVQVPKLDGKSEVPDVTETEVFPVLWWEERRYLSGEFYHLIRNRMFEKTIMKYGTLAMLALGCCLVLFPYPIKFLLEEMRGSVDASFPARSQTSLSTKEETEPDQIVSLWDPQRRRNFDKPTANPLDEEIIRYPSKRLKIDNFM